MKGKRLPWDIHIQILPCLMNCRLKVKSVVNIKMIHRRENKHDIIISDRKWVQSSSFCNMPLIGNWKMRIDQFLENLVVKTNKLGFSLWRIMLKYPGIVFELNKSDFTCIFRRENVIGNFMEVARICAIFLITLTLIMRILKIITDPRFNVLYTCMVL